MSEKIVYDNRIFKYLRISHDYNIKELSEKFGVSHSHILRIENGEKKPSDKILSLYSETFKVSTRLLNYFQTEITESEKDKKRVLNSREILLLILKGLSKEVLVDGEIL